MVEPTTVYYWLLVVGPLVINRPSSRFAEISPKLEPNSAGASIMCHEVATLVHPIESTKPAVRAKGIRLIALLEVPRLLEGRQYLASVAINNLWRDEALHDRKIAGDFVLMSPICVGESALSTGQREFS